MIRHSVPQGCYAKRSEGSRWYRSEVLSCTAFRTGCYAQNDGWAVTNF